MRFERECRKSKRSTPAWVTRKLRVNPLQVRENKKVLSFFITEKLLTILELPRKPRLAATLVVVIEKADLSFYLANST